MLSPVASFLPLLAQALPQAATPTGDLSFTLVLATVAYGVIGIVLCVAGYFVFDKIAGLDLQHELVEDQNMALGILLAGVFIGIAIVVAAAIQS